VSKPTAAAPHVALVLRLPVGWECLEPSPQLFGQLFGMIQIRRKPLTGFLGWLDHVIHRGAGSSNNEMYGIGVGMIYPRSMPGSSVRFIPGYNATTSERIDGIKREFHQMNVMGNRETFRTFEHPLGPALDAIAEGRSPGFVGLPGSLLVEMTYVLPDSQTFPLTPLIKALHIGTAMGARRDQSTWNEIVRRIRIIKN